MKNTALSYTALLAATLGVASCSDDIPVVSLGIDDTYRIARMQKLSLNPALTGSEYVWTVDGEVVAHTRDYIFLAAKEGTYRLSFEIIDEATPYRFDFTVEVLHEEVEYSPYISRVYEYCPAPGQFINEMPLYEDGDTYAGMVAKAEDCISGTNDVMISLGGYGGYVTFGFDHTVVNTPGQKDFRIWGNCFYELTDPSRPGGSSEPGIVAVSYDTNCNGVPDDPWYELAGSDYRSPSTLHGYTIRYRRGDGNGYPWTDSEGATGTIPQNMFHSQDYYPRWVDADELTFTGTCLAPNGVDTSGNGTYYILYSYPWGYVDNHPNDYPDLNSFDISWAVDADGNPVNLPGVDFVRVYTGVNQCCGWLGETSTEICRAADLAIDENTIQ